jgi:hypothetical protein
MSSRASSFFSSKATDMEADQLAADMKKAEASASHAGS